MQMLAPPPPEHSSSERRRREHGRGRCRRLRVAMDTPCAARAGAPICTPRRARRQALACAAMRWLPRSPRLRRIVFAYTVNRLGTWFGYVALSIVVFDHTHSAIAVAALLVAGQVLPAFLVPALVARVESSSAPSRAERAVLCSRRSSRPAWRSSVCCDFSLPLVLVLVAIDGTAALAASALLRAAAARGARAGASAEDRPRGSESRARDAPPRRPSARPTRRSTSASAITFTLGPALARR